MRRYFVMLIAALTFVSAAIAEDSGKIFGFEFKDKKNSAISAVSGGDVIYVAWTEDNAGVYVSILTQSGEKGNAIRVNTKKTPSQGIHQPPSIAIADDGTIYVAWTSPLNDDSFESDIYISSSVDKGKTFSKPVRINDNKEKSSRGFESIAIGKDGAVLIAWLDGRDKQKGRSSAYFAASYDKGKTFGKNVRLEGDVCPCCRTAIATDKGAHVYVSWRKVFEGDARDMVVAVSSDNGASFGRSVKVSEDNWVIAGCPHRGPSMAVDSAGVLYYTWYSEGEGGLPGAYAAYSTDYGKSFSKRVELPSSRGFFPDHPVVSSVSNGALFAWEEKTPVLSKVHSALFTKEKGFEKPVLLSSGVRQSSYPVFAGSSFVLWNYDEMKFKRVVAKRIK